MGDVRFDRERGTISTTDVEVRHTIWPCVPHGPDVTCEAARREHIEKMGVQLTPDVKNR